MPQTKDEKTALVTGGAQGIGRGIAGRLAGEGWRVVIADVDAEAVAEAAEELGPQVTGLTADVADEPAVAALMETVGRRFGRLDALIANAGITSPERVSLERLALANWNRVLAVNLTGVFLCCKYAVPLLRPVNGTIVTIASTRALQSEPDTFAYSASKGGIVALTHSLAVSLGPEIRVNCISPGWIVVDDWKKQGRRSEPHLSAEDHAQHPAGRAGRPEDVAALVSYLISPEAGFITGQNFVIDGGMTRRMIYVD